MRRFLIATAVIASAVAATPLPTWAQQPYPATAMTKPTASQPGDAPAVPVKQVVLFSSGVGYFEHGGTVNGNAATSLPFKAEQINDVLKSLVLQDLDGGRVSVVSYPSQDPLGKALRSFQVDLTSNPSMAELLNQLRGAKVTLTSAGGEKIEGTVLGVEKQKQTLGKDKDQIVEQPFANLVTPAGIKSVDLSTVKDVQLDDPALRDEMARALAAMASARDKDRKPVSINFAGDGERRVRVGYVVEAPIWKTSYRLILPDTESAKPKIQGWAIVENQTDSDWTDVKLSLVSGRPISFVQDLYTPLYVPRPTVVPELYASLRPQTYDDAIAADESKVEAFGRRGLAAQRARRTPAAPMAPAAAAPAPGQAPMGGFGGATAGGTAESFYAGNAVTGTPAMDVAASVPPVATRWDRL